MLPILEETPSTFFFKTRRKIELFGIVNEEITSEGSIQTNFVIDECFKIKKDANSIISMLDFYLKEKIVPGTSLILYTDNCPGQNKNYFVLGYLIYLVKIKKRYKEVELYFMIVGHIKFSPDAHFGMIKKKLQQAKCQSICDLIGENGLIQASSSSNRAICYKEFNSQIPNFRWYDWKAFIAVSV